VVPRTPGAAPFWNVVIAALDGNPPWRLTLTAVVVEALTVIDSVEVSRVVTPAASFGVAVTV
jgi:hypothetical protein